MDLIVSKSAEEINQSISASFDSVNLVNIIISQNITGSFGIYGDTEEEVIDILEGNAGHLSLMMSQSWFSSELSPSQSASIEASISGAIAY